MGVKRQKDKSLKDCQLFVGYSIKEQSGAEEMVRDVMCGWTSHSLDR